MNRTKRMLSALFVASLFAAPAMGAGDDVVPGPLPPEQTQGQVTYITGGVGQEEAAAMRMQAPRFPLSLEFIKAAKPNAEFLSGVNVTIKDQQGKTVLSTISDGPILLARIPPGRYTVTATAQDQVEAKQRNVVLAERKPERIVFEW
jgi:energy-converting hydrogenase Eha subunit F